jgi:hypothetical protein
MNWKKSLNQRPIYNPLYFDEVMVSDDRKTVRLYKNGRFETLDTVENFKRYLSTLDPRGLKFDLEGFLRLVDSPPPDKPLETTSQSLETSPVSETQ